MNRRDYLLSSAVLTIPLAGCTDGAPAPAEGNDTPSVGEGSPTDGDDQSTDEATQTETDSSESGKAEVVIDDAGAKLGIDESGYSDDMYVAVDLTNVGDAKSGTVEVQVDWLDENGDYLDDWWSEIASLNPGETWSARVYAALVDQEKIDDFDVYGEYESELDPIHDGVDLVSSALLAGEERVKVRGEVANNMNVTLNYVEFNAKIYNKAGEVMGGAWTNEADIPKGSSVRFDPEWDDAGDRASKAVDHEVVLRTNVY